MESSLEQNQNIILDTSNSIPNRPKTKIASKIKTGLKTGITAVGSVLNKVGSKIGQTIQSINKPKNKNSPTHEKESQIKGFNVINASDTDLLNVKDLIKIISEHYQEGKIVSI